MSIEVIDFIIVSVVLLSALGYIFFKIKNALQNKGNSQCSACDQGSSCSGEVKKDCGSIEVFK